MPKISVYVSDDMYAAVRKYHIAVSSVTQAALHAEVARRANDDWIARAHRRTVRTTPVDTGSVLHEVRNEFGA